MKTKTKYKFRPAFNPAIEMGVLINTSAVGKYRRRYGLAALGELMGKLSQLAQQQDRRRLAALPVVGQVTTRAAGSESNPW